MRRTTTRSPSGRNFIGILFFKRLNLLDFEQVAALTFDECQSLRPVFREGGGTGQAPGAGLGRKKCKGRWAADEQSVSFWAFFGYFALPQQQLTSCRRCSCAVQPAPP